MKLVAIIGLLIMFSVWVYAEDRGYTGFTLDVSVSGFFSPELVSIDVKEVKPDSPAEKSGIRVGDKLIEIDGCKIPGCPAHEGKRLISKPKGQLLPLMLQRADGSEYSATLVVE